MRKWRGVGGGKLSQGVFVVGCALDLKGETVSHVHGRDGKRQSPASVARSVRILT